MRKYLCALALLALATLPAQANLGETEEQSIARYGEPMNIMDPSSGHVAHRTLLFAHDWYTFSAIFIDNKCTWLRIAKADETPLAGTDIDALLNANSEGLTWQKKENSAFWIRDDGARAAYIESKHALILVTPVTRP